MLSLHVVGMPSQGHVYKFIQPGPLIERRSLSFASCYQLQRLMPSIEHWPSKLNVEYTRLQSKVLTRS
jgi:hypothetical protein